MFDKKITQSTGPDVPLFKNSNKISLKSSTKNIKPGVKDK